MDCARQEVILQNHIASLSKCIYQLPMSSKFVISKKNKQVSLTASVFCKLILMLLPV